MTWNFPTWWGFLLLALAAFRLWRLIGEDVILERPRNWLERRYGDRGEYWAAFVTCPWCAGAWIAIGWWLAWIAWPHWTLVVATPFAISAVAGLIAANIDPE